VCELVPRILDLVGERRPLVRRVRMVVSDLEQQPRLGGERPQAVDLAV
jgi:hypothetical protein